MKIGLDATSLTARRAGIGRYTSELLRALRRHEPAIDLRLMAHRPTSKEFTHDERGTIEVLRGPGFRVRWAWMQAVLPALAASNGIDVCHFTNYHAPLRGRVPFVVNIHDMSLFLTPERHPTRRVLANRPMLRAVAHRARAVICLTQAARSDALRVLDLDPARAYVVPAAPAAHFAPIGDYALLESAAARHGLRPGFLLYVGTIEPRKNLVRLVHAYARLRSDGFGEPLVICGGHGWKSTDLLRTIAELGLTRSIHFTGHVSDVELVALYNLAAVFCYPSLYEGFGLPIIEALACGVPTVTADRGATAEVAGDAALLVDPEDLGALTDALSLALSDSPTRDRLTAAGPARAAEFSWESAAHATAAIYRSVLDGSA
jgi:glycosyltransferase involved in cell wall biosynthesis